MPGFERIPALLSYQGEIMPNIKILTAGDASLLIEFGKEISPEINAKITAVVQLMKEQLPAHQL